MDYATVEGTLRFEVPREKLAGEKFLIDVTIPVVCRAGTPDRDILKLFRARSSANASFFLKDPSVMETAREEPLPTGLSVFWISWIFEPTDQALFDLAFEYTQPLYGDKFYYIPWTMDRASDPSPPDEPADARLQITIHPAPGFRVEMHSPQKADLVGMRSVTVFARHRNMIVSSQSKLD